VRGTNPEFIVAAITGSLALATLALAPSQIPGETLAAAGNLQSPAFFPILAACVMAILSVALVIRAAAQERTGQGLRISFPHAPTVASVAGLFIIFAASTYLFGLVNSAVVIIAAIALVMGYRDWRVLVVVALLVPLAIYLLFQRLLLVILPSGVLFQ
jgi:putative tricarboxylic transport membrane protein